MIGFIIIKVECGILLQERVKMVIKHPNDLKKKIIELCLCLYHPQTEINFMTSL